ncbi:MFS transporter [Kineosporia sp. A_224]|uniref:MFS transporter n=1 Tax=Kineosporia sp. A_224 TaxID=1962180 RepID=UPI000B4B5510|nr:MFS transporter [Kineosporia sp. A_224]
MSLHAHHTAHDAPTGQTRKPWTVMAIALVAQILVVLDISVVNTALPSIGQALRLGPGNLQAVVTAYLMVSGGGLLLGGRITDLASRRTVFLAGLALFTLASLASGFATDATWLVTTRAAQGLAAAVLTPSALSLVMTTYDGDQRRKGLAAWGIVGSLGVAAGVLVGGALTTWVSWQLIFWVNVPIGAVALLAGLHAIARDTVADRTGAHGSLVQQLDLPGAALLVAGLATLVHALSVTSTHGWTSARTIAELGCAAAFLAGFVTWERHARQPLFPPHVWGIRTLVSGTTVMLGVTGLLVGTVFLTSILLQARLGYSALAAGVAFLPFAVAITVGAVAARHALAHLAPRTVASTGLLIAGAAAVLLSNVPDDARYAADLLPGLVALGLGVGMVFVPVSVTAMTGIPESHAGLASGFLMTGHEVGAALGVAVLSAAANTAGSLVDPARVVDAFDRGLVVGGAVAAALGLLAWLGLPASTVAGSGSAHMHH